MVQPHACDRAARSRATTMPRSVLPRPRARGAGRSRITAPGSRSRQPTATRRRMRPPTRPPWRHRRPSRDRSWYPWCWAWLLPRRCRGGRLLAAPALPVRGPAGRVRPAAGSGGLRARFGRRASEHGRRDRGALDGVGPPRTARADAGSRAGPDAAARRRPSPPPPPAPTVDRAPRPAALVKPAPAPEQRRPRQPSHRRRRRRSTRSRRPSPHRRSAADAAPQARAGRGAQAGRQGPRGQVQRPQPVRRTSGAWSANAGARSLPRTPTAWPGARRERVGDGRRFSRTGRYG